MNQFNFRNVEIPPQRYKLNKFQLIHLSSKSIYCCMCLSTSSGIKCGVKQKGYINPRKTLYYQEGYFSIIGMLTLNLMQIDIYCKLMCYQILTLNCIWIYPPESGCEGGSQGVQLNTLTILLVQETALGVSKAQAVIGLVEILKMFFICGGEGWTEQRKCHSIFFIPCVLLYLFVYLIKNSHQHSYGFKI